MTTNEEGKHAMTERTEEPAENESDLLPDSEDDFEQPTSETSDDVEHEPPASDDDVQDDGTDVELDDDASSHAERDTR